MTTAAHVRGKQVPVVRSGQGTTTATNRNFNAATTSGTPVMLRDPARTPARAAVHSSPIIPDEARTFGMDSFFPTIKIYNPNGQQYTPWTPS